MFQTVASFLTVRFHKVVQWALYQQLHYKFTAEHAGERILKIGYLVKLQVRIWCLPFYETHSVHTIQWYGL